MPTQLPHEEEVFAAIRGFLRTGGEAQKFRDCMSILVDATSRLPLSSFEVWERKIRSELWVMEDTSTSDRWRFWKKRKDSASWLDLCSGDGFKREKILRTGLESAPNAFFCLLAIRRLNDWVPQVRVAAREHVPLMAKRSDPEHVADALWYTVSHYNSWGRAEDEDRQVISDLIAIEKVSTVLRSRIMSATAGPAASVLAQAGRTSVVDQWLDQISVGAIQPSVRDKAYRYLLDGRVVWVAGRKWTWTDVRWCKGRFDPVLGERKLSVTRSIPEKLRMASADRSSLVRRVVGQYLIRHIDDLDTESYSLARRQASDSSPHVAELGQFVLKRLSINDEGIDTRRN